MGAKVTDSPYFFGSKLKQVGNVLKSGSEIFDKVGNVANELERMRG
jgi:hypothetical protein